MLGSIPAAAVTIPLGIGVLNAQRAPSHPAASVAADTTPGQQDRSDVHCPGQDVTWPKLVHDVKPAYTREAMDAGIQGVVLLEAIVLEDGSVARVDVVRSLDAVYGLDDEAVTH